MFLNFLFVYFILNILICKISSGYLGVGDCHISWDKRLKYIHLLAHLASAGKKNEITYFWICFIVFIVQNFSTCSKTF